MSRFLRLLIDALFVCFAIFLILLLTEILVYELVYLSLIFFFLLKECSPVFLFLPILTCFVKITNFLALKLLAGSTFQIAFLKLLVNIFSEFFVFIF